MTQASLGPRGGGRFSGSGCRISDTGTFAGFAPEFEEFAVLSFRGPFQARGSGWIRPSDERHLLYPTAGNHASFRMALPLPSTRACSKPQLRLLPFRSPFFRLSRRTDNKAPVIPCPELRLMPPFGAARTARPSIA